MELEEERALLTHLVFLPLGSGPGCTCGTWDLAPHPVPRLGTAWSVRSVLDPAWPLAFSMILDMPFAPVQPQFLHLMECAGFLLPFNK